MTFRQYITLMSTATALCSFSWGLVLWNVDPYYANTASFLFFYAGAFLSLFGLISIISCAVYFVRSRAMLFRLVQKSFRVSFFISVLSTILLFLQGRGLIHLWTALLFIASAASLMAFVYAVKRRDRLPPMAL